MTVSDTNDAITRRFFQALDTAMKLGRIESLTAFCNKHGLNRTRYSKLRTAINRDADCFQYRNVDISALAAICNDFNVSPDWLLLGRGKMLRSTTDED